MAGPMRSLNQAASDQRRQIYRQVGSSTRSSSLVIGQDWDGDVRVVLFVRCATG
jgi:hypothetical protein